LSCFFPSRLTPRASRLPPSRFLIIHYKFMIL
jgi:hypothetical protein